MESRVGWNRALQTARRYETWVLYGEPHEAADLAAHAAAAGVGESLHFVQVPHGAIGRRLIRSAHLFWRGYALWQKQALQAAAELHRTQPFDLVHQVNYCGYREPGYAWKLDAPFVIGPVGGTHNFPLRYLGEIDLRGGVREFLRNFVNSWHFRFRRRVVGAYRRADAVLTANTAGQRDFQRVLGIESICQLETGIVAGKSGNKPQRDPSAPLRILWSGRCRSWKALPILLKALASVSPDCRYELRVLGTGPCLGRWQALAEKLGIAAAISWVGWPPYDQTLCQYDWADVFAFTSLRDTSGAGLLESLAAGVPIVGLDHQGAADIMTEDCAIPISVDQPAKSIAEFRRAIESLAQQPKLLARLSEGASRRAEYYCWNRQGERMDEVYRRVFESTQAAAAGEKNATSRGSTNGVPSERTAADSQQAVLMTE
jgi:glycosyltransferase involved in cell wall biosynthesis